VELDYRSGPAVGDRQCSGTEIGTFNVIEVNVQVPIPAINLIS